MIREIQLKDKEQWEKLYKGYANFYKVEMNDKILKIVWKWLHDKNHEINGLVYEVDKNIVGFDLMEHSSKNPKNPHYSDFSAAKLINKILCIIFKNKIK